MKLGPSMIAAALALALAAPSASVAAPAKEPPRTDCKMVSERKRVKEYITKFYMTTWGSAWAEGGTQGFSEGLQGQGSAAEAIRTSMLRPKKTPEAIFLELPTNVKPYCRVFASDRLSVAEAVRDLLPLLGNKVVTSNVRTGVFRTDVIDRSHIAARWKDSYIITVTEEGPERVVVRILRTVFISRDNATYNQGVSDGHNEGWILTQVSDRLAR